MIPSRPDHFLSRIAFLSAMVGVAGFFTWQIGRFFTPPRVIVVNPKDALMTRDESLTLAGSLKETARLTINGEAVYVDPERYEFQETAPLLTGENTFVFRAEDRLGRVREVVRRVYRF